MSIKRNNSIKNIMVTIIDCLMYFEMHNSKVIGLDSKEYNPGSDTAVFLWWINLLL